MPPFRGLLVEIDVFFCSLENFDKIDIFVCSIKTSCMLGRTWTSRRRSPWWSRPFQGRLFQPPRNYWWIYQEREQFDGISCFVLLSNWSSSRPRRQDIKWSFAESESDKYKMEVGRRLCRRLCLIWAKTCRLWLKRKNEERHLLSTIHMTFKLKSRLCPHLSFLKVSFNSASTVSLTMIVTRVEEHDYSVRWSQCQGVT